MDIHADFISTLEVASNDLVHNVTTVTCRAGKNEKQLVINKLGKQKNACPTSNMYSPIQ